MKTTSLNVLLFFFSLEDVLMEESMLHLVFEHMSMDLRKYMDVKLMDGNKIKSFLYQVNIKSYPLDNKGLKRAKICRLWLPCCSATNDECCTGT